MQQTESTPDEERGILPSPSQPDNRPPSNFTVAAVSIGAYCVISLSIVYFNWWLFTGSFQYPVFVSWVQQVTGFGMYYIFSLLGTRFEFFSVFHLKCLDYKTAIKVLPLTLNFVGMVGLANLCLKFVQVSTYQVARSLTIFFTMGLSYLFLGEVQSMKTKLACGVLVLGFIIGSLDTSTLSLGGVLFGASSSLFQAMYNVMIKRTLPHLNGDTNLMLMYNLGLSSVLFLPVVFISGEGKVFLDLPYSPKDVTFAPIWLSLFMSGILATSMNLASYICVKATSPLTFNIVGITKALVQTMGGFIFLGDSITLPSVTGISLSLLGSGWYSQVKLSEANRQSQQEAAPRPSPFTIGVTPDTIKRAEEDEESRAAIQLTPPTAASSTPPQQSVDSMTVSPELARTRPSRD
eukprot:GHVO01016808.1.p1 GENE.GHVO01016808.1~~GHVO01016808.1.p1  ORF type:complete len:406 (+),score=57.54 GHVO01016808.1:18-1235(+)